MKFAKYNPEPSENESHFQNSWEFVIATKEAEVAAESADEKKKMKSGGRRMTGITFAEPLFLYLLAVIPAMIAFYVLKQHKTTASLRMPGYSHLKKQEQLSGTI